MDDKNEKNRLKLIEETQKRIKKLNEFDNPDNIFLNKFREKI